ncbi:MAG: c-type cytochrome [Kiloniellales bacterium]|nr:c-type cytochrome [Kiloniellales bacterium]
MMMPSRFALLPLIALNLTDNAFATVEDRTVLYGASLLQNYCARCHSIGATGNSPLEKAPPLREVYQTYPIQQLESGFAEGMGSRHQDMPQIQFSTEEVDAILDYLGEITGSPPSQRPRFDIPDETVPP